MRDMNLYGRIAWFTFGTYLAYPFEMIASILRPMIDFGFLVLFWTMVAASTHHEIQLTGLASYFLLATGISNIVLIDSLKFGSFLAKDIKRGRLSNALVKPVNPLLYEFARLIGDRGINTAISIVFVFLGILVQPPVSWIGIGLLVLYLPLAITISLSLNILIGSVAFYFTESSGVKNVFDHIIRVFSGALVPLYLFPGTVKIIATSLPFATAVYWPAHALRVVSIGPEVWLSLVTGLGWSIFLLWLSLWLWRRGLKNYEAVGI